MDNTSIYVKDKLLEDTYKKMENLKELNFKYGNIIYFSKENIDEGQQGYRYNALTKERIEDWPDNFIIVGVDNSIGDGGEPIILKVDETNLPVYHFENGDWNYPTIIADNFDDYIKINNKIFEYLENIKKQNINETYFHNLTKEISRISDNYYWMELLARL